MAAPPNAGAYDRLMLAYAARDAARARARAEVDRLFAPVIAKRTEEFSAANAATARNEELP